jgi:hypothetical protein
MIWYDPALQWFVFGVLSAIIAVILVVIGRSARRR